MPQNCLEPFLPGVGHSFALPIKFSLLPRRSYSGFRNSLSSPSFHVFAVLSHSYQVYASLLPFLCASIFLNFTVSNESNRLLGRPLSARFLCPFSAPVRPQVDGKPEAKSKGRGRRGRVFTRDRGRSPEGRAHLHAELKVIAAPVKVVEVASSWHFKQKGGRNAAQP